MDLEFSSRFRRRLKRKPAQQREQVKDTLRLMAQNLRHPGLHTHKIQGTQGVFECYASDAIRVTFQFSQQGRIYLRNNCQHQPVLRFP